MPHLLLCSALILQDSPLVKNITDQEVIFHHQWVIRHCLYHSTGCIWLVLIVGMFCLLSPHYPAFSGQLICAFSTVPGTTLLIKVRFVLLHGYYGLWATTQSFPTWPPFLDSTHASLNILTQWASNNKEKELTALASTLRIPVHQSWLNEGISQTRIWN